MSLNVLCIGNGGLICREGDSYSHRFLAEFLDAMSKRSRVCFCGWAETSIDPLSYVPICGHGISALALPAFRGELWGRLVNGITSLFLLAGQIYGSDFVYIFWPGRLSIVVAAICRLIGKPYGIYLRGEPPREDAGLALAFHGAKFVLTTGEALRAVGARYCRDVEPVVPMTLLKPKHLKTKQVSRKPGAPWRLLYVGRIEKEKGIFDLFSALSLIASTGLDFELKLFGHCQNRVEFSKHLASNVADRVQWLGAVGDFNVLSSIYLSADVFVFPSHEEGFPRVLYEAMAFGLPVITTFVGGIATVMEDGVNCRRINVRDPSDIAEKVIRVVNCPITRENLAVAGKQTMSRLITKWDRGHADQIAERFPRIFAGSNMA